MTYASDIYHYIMANKTNKHKIYSEGDRHHRQVKIKLQIAKKLKWVQ